MKHLFLNLKRFDISPANGGVNRLASMSGWAETIVKETQDHLRAYAEDEVQFTMYFPEAHLLKAAETKNAGSPIRLGSQSVYRQDTATGGNFGAFTSLRTAHAVKELGCESTIIGHCEERTAKMSLLAMAGVNSTTAANVTNTVLNAEIKAAQAAGLTVLYCIGEKSEEQSAWQQVLGDQLDQGLSGVDKTRVVIAYEPVWSIGPGKTPADQPYITKIAKFVKERTGGIPVVYGGGLNQNNAKMLAGIDEIDGGLIALTRFSGEIGFYPEEYLEITKLYLGK